VVDNGGMRPNPLYAVDDPDVVRDLIRANPWATIVSNTDEGLVASHYPVLLDDGPDLAVVTHLGRPDDRVHQLGEGREVLVIVQGTHGYVPPSWYAPGASQAPTWNFSVAHLSGVPEVLDAEENLDVLTRLVAHFEQHVDEPMYLDRTWATPVARGTVGLRIPVSRFVCRVKLSQDKDPQSVDNVIAALRRPGPYQQAELADQMERARD
jgi:transcriptional regulator